MPTAIFIRTDKRHNWSFKSLMLDNASAFEYAKQLLVHWIVNFSRTSQALVRDYQSAYEIPEALYRTEAIQDKELLEREDIEEELKPYLASLQD